MVLLNAIDDCFNVINGIFHGASCRDAVSECQYHKRKIGRCGKLKKAGLADLTKAELEAIIRKKLRMSYLYNLEWVDEPTHQLSKFNIMLEFPRQNGHPERTVVALEYKPAERVLRLVTIS